MRAAVVANRSRSRRYRRLGAPSTQLALDPGRLAAECRYCGDEAVPGLRCCRLCWGYIQTGELARFMLDKLRRQA